MRKVLEEKVLDSHVDLTLRELLGIAKKEFHDTIVDLIKRKRQQSDEEEVKTSAITMTRSEEEQEEEVMVYNHYSQPLVGHEPIVCLQQETHLLPIPHIHCFDKQ